MTRKLLRLLTVAATVATAAVVAPAPAQAAPYCGLTWGSLPEASTASDSEVVTGVRAGQHTCFDRMVVDLGAGDAGFGSYDVRYVPVVHEDGSGRPVPVRGAADLQIVLRAPSYDREGDDTFRPADRGEVVDVSGWPTFRQVAWAGSYEGYTTMALGVRARLPFRVLVLPGTAGPRLVVDVAHAW